MISVISSLSKSILAATLLRNLSFNASHVLSARRLAWILVALSWICYSTNANAIELVNDGVVSGSISVPGESDEYTFDANAGEVLHIRVVDPNSRAFAPKVWLYNPDDSLNQVSSDNVTVAFDCNVSSGNCQLNQTGTYRLVVEDNTHSWTGGYEIHFARVLQSNENGALVNDGVVVGDITEGDIDTFVFDASAGEVLHIRVVEPNSKTFSPKVWLYNPDGSLNQVSSDGVTVAYDCNVSPGNCQLNQTGTYRLVVEDNIHTNYGSYEIHFARVLSTNENGSLVNDGVVVGDITPGDIDTFVFDASAGEVLHIRVVDPNSRAFAPKVWLYNPDDSLNQVSSDNVTVAFDCNVSSGNCQLNQTGTYRLVVEDNTHSWTGGYEIHFARVLQSNENGALVNDGVVVGDITEGDIDTFVFDASAGEVLHIRVVEPNSKTFSPKVWLYNPDGSLNQVSSDGVTVAYDCNVSPGNCQLNQTGTYRLVVEDNIHTNYGSYEIHFARVLSTNENGSLVNDGVVVGDITPGDIDTFVFDASAGEVLHIRVVDPNSRAFAPKVWLYNPDGSLNQVSSDNVTVAFDCNVSSGNCQLNQTGTYRLVVADNGNNNTGTYEISFEGPQQFTVSNAPPFWDERYPAGPAVQLRWTPSRMATDYEVYRDGVKIYPTIGIYTERSFRNEIGLTPGQTYSYYIMANNAEGANKSNIISVGPMPYAPATPNVISISPDAIVQGNGHQDVTISGGDFTGSSWHQFSTDGGVTWVPAQSAPTINDSMSMTVAVNNTIVRTVLIRVCATYIGTACSASVPVNIEAALSPIAPRLSQVLPDTIAQGSGAQEVTLNGVGFTSANRYQASTDGGITWSWSLSEPIINSPTSITVTVDDTSLGTILLRVCAVQGSGYCSGSVAVSVQSAPTISPTVSSVSPDTILQGADYRNVTIFGSDFTGTSWHQISVDEGSTWDWAQSKPTINDSGSITVAVNDKDAGAVLIRVCTSYGIIDCSGSVSVTIEPKEQPSVLGTTCPSSTCDTGSTNAVVIAHGLLADADSWVKDLAYRICDEIGQHVYDTHLLPDTTAPADTKTLVCTAIADSVSWDVWIVDWQTKAASVSAWKNADETGHQLGMDFKRNYHYQHYHFIAHSMGSKLIEGAAKVLGPDHDIDETFFDAFDRDAIVPSFTTDIARHVSKYGQYAKSKWVDNYVDTRNLCPEMPITTLLSDPKLYLYYNVACATADLTDLHLTNGYNINVTPDNGCTGLGIMDEIFCKHGRPYRFYADSVYKPFIDDFYSYVSDPLLSAGDMGFPLSLEDGGNMRFLELGGDLECQMQNEANGSCVPIDWTPYVWTYFPGALKDTIVNDVKGTVDFLKSAPGKLYDRVKLTTSSLFSGFSILSATQASATISADDPAYISVQVTTTTPVNVLRFNWGFDIAGEGLLQVFVNGELVHQIDQRFVPQASDQTEEVNIGGVDGILSPGTYEIAFRLDGFGANPSDIELTDVELSLVQVVDANAYKVIPAAATGGSVSPNLPQSVNPGDTTSFTVTANEGYTTSSTVGGDCPQGSWFGETWTTGTINDNCTVSFSFDLLDADGDGVTDASDNCVVVANTNQRDTDGDGYGNLCDADLNNSGGVVNFADLAAFKSVFGTNNIDADFNGSGGVVNFADLAIFKQLFGIAPGPSGLVP